MDYILKAEDVSKAFGGIVALDKVNIQVAHREIVAILGPNGSGKTTLINVITGVYMPDTGRILLNNKAIQRLPRERICRSGIARTFQNIHLFKTRNVLDNVRIGSHHLYKSGLLDVVFHTKKFQNEHSVFTKKAMALLEFVGLAEKANVVSENLPYAQQRFVEIARALATDPAVLLLDEPAAGMNAVEIQNLDGLIKKIRDRGITIILIEHIMDLVRGVCDRVYVLNNGQNIAEGTFKEIEQNSLVKEAYLGKGKVHHA
jgi:ABC-type branched-subunit amino acid transport system ATPase component